MNFRHSKILKITVLVVLMGVTSACEVLQQVTQQTNKLQSPKTSLCVTQEQDENFEAYCEMSQWFQYIVDAQALTWPQREKMIANLGEDTPSLLEKILLSQGVDTPYQYRLRAQNWIEKVNINAPTTIKIVLLDLIYENSKQLLEFESAITILSRVNSRQEKSISELEAKVNAREQEIQTQQDQVEQLLKIESDLIEQNRNEER